MPVAEVRVRVHDAPVSTVVVGDLESVFISLPLRKAAFFAEDVRDDRHAVGQWLLLHLRLVVAKDSLGHLHQQQALLVARRQAGYRVRVQKGDFLQGELSQSLVTTWK